MHPLSNVLKAHRLLSVVRNKERYSILLYLSGRRGSRPQEMEQRLNIKRNNLGDHLSMMISVGLLVKEKETHKLIRYSIDEKRLEQVMEGVRILTMSPDEYNNRA